MKFGLEVIKLVESLPSEYAVAAMGNQLIRSGASVGANYRAACRAKSPADFISKMGTVEEETDESMYWLEMLVEAKKIESQRVEPLFKEAEELLRITVASIKTARGNR